MKHWAEELGAEIIMEGRRFYGFQTKDGQMFVRGTHYIVQLKSGEYRAVEAMEFEKNCYLIDALAEN